MPEATAAPTATTAPAQTATAEPATGPQGADLQAEVDKWRSLSRKHEDQAKANAAAAQKLAAIEEAQKTEAQKAADREAAATKRAETAEAQAMRYEIGIDKKVPPHLIRYLTGATKEELEANAAQIIADFGADTGPATAAGGRPREALRPGASAAGTATDGNQAINDRIRQAARRS